MSSSTSTSTIGIDLGTTYSCVGVFQHGKVEIIANDQGNRTTPSYVAFTDTEWFAGEVAKSQSTRNPENTVFNAKRMLGRSYNDREMEADLKHWPFKVVNERGEPRVQVQYKGETKLFSPVEISSMILTKMKMTAEAYLGQKVTDAVITVPAYFNNAQRQATKDAGQIAGLNVKRIINEPTAAALAYGLDKKLKDNKKEMNILIFDLGGGTFDVSVLEVADGVLEVLATRGDTHLGGEDFDHRLAQHFAMEFKRQHKKDIRDNPLALRRLKIACEEVKRALSSSSTGYLEVCGLFEGIDFSGKITRARFDELCGDLFRGTLETVQQALDDAKLDRSQIDEVVLVGGSTRIPKIRKLLEDFFDGKKLNVRINADEAVAYGAAIQAAALSKISVPGSEEQLLLDVVPYSLGVREGEDNFQKLIERNSHVPIRVEREFILGRDYQTAADVLVYEGELPRASDNHLLGQFQLEGLPAKKRGEVKLVIVYDVDADGIMHVTAKDKMSGRSNEITIRCLEYMGTDELKRMQEDAARMEAEARRQEEQLRQEVEEDEDENGGRRQDSRNDEGRNKPRDVLSSGSERDRRERGERFDEAKRDETSQLGRQETTNKRRVNDEDEDDRQRKSSDQHQDRESRSRGHDNRSTSSREKDRETTPTRDAERTTNPARSPSSSSRDSSTAQNSGRADSPTGKGRNKSDSSTTQGRRNQPDSSTAQEPIKAEPPPQTAAAAGIASDDILVIIKTLLDAEPSTSREERTKVRQHCVKMLTQLAVSSDPQVRTKCKELRKQLRDKYGNGREASPEKKIRPLRERARSYLCELVQSLVLIEVGDAQDQVEEVNELCMDMMAWLDEEESPTDEQIMEKMDELQTLGRNVKGLTMPSDDVIRAPVTS